MTKRPTSLTLVTKPMLRPVMKSQKNHSGSKLFLRWLWNLAQHRVVATVPNRSIESSRMKRLMVVYEFSQRTIRVTSQTAARLSLSSLAVQ